MTEFDSNISVEDRLAYLKESIEIIEKKVQSGLIVKRCVSKDAYLTTSDELASILNTSPTNMFTKVASLLVAWKFKPSEWTLTVTYMSGYGERERKVFVIPRVVGMAVLLRSDKNCALGLAYAFDTIKAMAGEANNSLLEDYEHMICQAQEAKTNQPDEIIEIVNFLKGANT